MSQYTLVNSLFVSLSIALSILGYGLYNFLSQWPYSEQGHGYLLGAYVVATILVFLCLRLSRIGTALVLVVILLGVMIYANQKFEWRKSYILSAQSGKFLPVDQYMDQYPTFEEHTFAWLLKTPRWIDFSKECYEPLFKISNASGKKDIGRNCQTADLIKDYYRIDVVDVIQDHYKKMQYTANMLNKGKLKTKRKFEKCINDKRCTMIPLLPERKEGEASLKNEQDLETAKQFWSLIEDKKMSPANCKFFDFCRAMVREEIVDFDRL